MNALAVLCLLALAVAPGAWAAVPAFGPVLGPAAAVAAGVRWVAPLDGPLVVRRAFSAPAVRWGAGHRGVDLASYAGAPVRAAGPGTVSYAGFLAGRGVVAVTHGALRTTYEPVHSLLPRGTPVEAGHVVALVVPGHAGPDDTSLHWGLLRGETYLDPLWLLRRGPSRLVPVAPPPPAVAAGPHPAIGAPPPAAPGGEPSGTPAAAPTAAVAGAAALAAFGVSRAGRRASRAAAGPPSYASGRYGSRSRPGPGRSPPA